MADFMPTRSIRLSWDAAIQSPYIIGTALSFIGFLIWIYGALIAQGQGIRAKAMSPGPMTPVEVVERFPDDEDDDSDIRVSKILIHPIKVRNITSM